MSQASNFDCALAGRRVTVMGLGRHGGGVAAVRFLAQHGARVTITDSADPHALAESLAELADVQLADLRLGGHVAEDFINADLLVVNPAVRLDNPFVQLARERHVPLTSEIELFLRRCRAKVIGVTGSNGKSTTAAMTAAALRQSDRRTWLGGNIQRSLLPDLSKIDAGDVVVLELSSFQLAWLNADVPWPGIAVLTGCTPNHLDWHGRHEDYVGAKKRIIQHGSAAQRVVMHDDPEMADFAAAAGPRRLPVASVDLLPRLKVPGEHNRRNAMLAVTAAVAAGGEIAAIQTGLSQFAGLPHRLQTVANVQGRRLINDSQSTTPEATVAALGAVADPCWLLAGGADKGCPLDDLAARIATQTRGAAFFGERGDALFEAVTRRKPDSACIRVETLAEAFRWCWQRAESGDAILLSPACSSGDQYRDYADRAADFASCCRRLTGHSAHLETGTDLL